MPISSTPPCDAIVCNELTPHVCVPSLDDNCPPPPQDRQSTASMKRGWEFALLLGNG